MTLVEEYRQLQNDLFTNQRKRRYPESLEEALSSLCGAEEEADEIRQKMNNIWSQLTLEEQTEAMEL